MQPTSISRLARAGVTLALSFAVAACGRAGDGARGTGNAGSDGTGDDTSGDIEEVPMTVPSCLPGRLPRRVVWLSDLQFANAIEQLLGAAALDAAQLPEPGPEPVFQNSVLVDRALLEARLDVAVRASASLEGRVTEVTGCAANDDACARAFIAALATQAFRRPVPEAELADLNAVYDAGRETDLETGVRLAVQAVIASSSFNYRRELGAGAVTGAPVELTPHELASMISFWLTDSPPDASLASAADRGELSDAAELARHAERLLAEPEARDTVAHTLMSAWSMGRLDGGKDPALFPEYGPALRRSMLEETRLFLQHTLWDAGNLDEVLTSRTSFVDRALADSYGVPFSAGDPNDFIEVELPARERAGLLTQASLLSTFAYTDDTSVADRGVFVRAGLLCLPGPPPKADMLFAEAPELRMPGLTERERAQFRAETVPCVNCHESIDPFGLLFENYDAIGRYRRELEGEPIDASVSLDGVGFPGTFQGVVDFANTVAESPDFTACVARHLAVDATGAEDLATTDCEFAVLRELPPGEASLRQIIAGLAGSALLGTRAGE